MQPHGRLAIKIAMPSKKSIQEKYERQGWPSIQRPDLLPPDGWDLHLITGVNRIRNHSLSPDGSKIAFIWDREGQSDVYVQPASGGWPQRISFNRKAVAYWSDEIPRWSADSQNLAFTLDGHVHIAAVSEIASLPKKISDFTSAAFSPVWMPDGRQLVVSTERRDHVQLLLTDRDGRWPRQLVADPSGDAWDAQPSPDGSLIAFVWRPFDDLLRLDLRTIDLQSGEIRTVVGKPGTRAWSPRWSPDGKWLAFLSEQPDFNEVWFVKPDGSGLRQLSRAGHDLADLAWSPGGDRIACTVNRAGAFDLALLDAASGSLLEIGLPGGYHARPNWSPDGRFLTFEYENPQQPPDIYRCEPENRGKALQLTNSKPPALAGKDLVVPERVAYSSSDGFEIPAFLYRPPRPNGAAVIHPHGGPSSQYVLEWDILAQYFVAKGYTWLAPNYRGSTGYGFEFEHANYGDWGGGDARDCLAGADFARELDWVQAEKIAIYGGSYGGYMTACCLSRDPDYRFAAGISKYGDANLYSSWAQCNRDLRLYSEIFLGHPSKNPSVYATGSPIYEVENVQKPVLILHGLLDDVVPPEASEEWVEALHRAGKTYEYKTYAGEPHGFLQRSTQLDSYQRIERFLDWHLRA